MRREQPSDPNAPLETSGLAPLFFLCSHGESFARGSRSQKRIDERLETLALAVELISEGALLESYQLRLRCVCSQLKVLNQTLGQYERRIAEAFACHPDQEIFASLPGAGPTFAPRLLAAMGARRERYADGRPCNVPVGWRR